MYNRKIDRLKMNLYMKYLENMGRYLKARISKLITRLYFLMIHTHRFISLADSLPIDLQNPHPCTVIFRVPQDQDEAGRLQHMRRYWSRKDKKLLGKFCCNFLLANPIITKTCPCNIQIFLKLYKLKIFNRNFLILFLYLLKT